MVRGRGKGEAMPDRPYRELCCRLSANVTLAEFTLAQVEYIYKTVDFFQSY